MHNPGFRPVAHLLLLAVLATSPRLRLEVAAAVGPSQDERTPGAVERFRDDLLPREPPFPPLAKGRFALLEGEVVVFVGQANLVFEHQRGPLEAQLAAAFAAQQPRFRNMAWEGDTVYEQWRDLNFGDWRQQLTAADASLLIAWFGQMEALDGPGRLGEFTAAYAKLLDQFAARTPRLVLVSPLPFEPPALSSVPDLSARNEDVKLYTDAIRRLAHDRHAIFVDLLTPLNAPARQRREPRLTDNGIHLNERGQQVVAGLIARQLGVKRRPWPKLEALREEIVEKNRLWFDCWRAMNWAFAYGDRTEQLFGTESPARPPLVEELKQFKPLLRDADARMHALALGHKPPVARGAAPPPPPQQATLSPDEELASFTPLDGFAVNLFASEADGLVKPVKMAWDERGRLWAACIPTYPQIEPAARPADYILVCEDTNGDGRADKFTRFAEGLFMPMGIEFGDGGAYVCEATQLWHFRDTDGDGRADQRRVVLSGFGTGDTHQLINSIRWGADGALWLTQGHHIYSRIETPFGVARLDKSGVWQFWPRRLQLHGYFNLSTAGANDWDVEFDDWGQVFHNSGDIWIGYYTVPGMVPTLHPLDYNPVGPLFRSQAKNTGLDFIGTRHLPDELQGCAVVGVFMSGEVEAHRLQDDGAGYKSERAAPLLRSSRTEFRPVDVNVGPDGAIYVCDWFNKVIGHYQASYRHPERDKSHGRIWRISAKDRPPVKQPNLAAMSPAQLLDELRSPERWTRQQAQRLLFNAPKAAVLAAADKWLARLDRNDPQSGRLLIDLLGVYAAHEVIRHDVLEKLLNSPDARVRAVGTRMLAHWADRLPDVLSLLRERIADEHPRVRLAAVVACSHVKSPEAVEVAMRALDLPHDRFLDYALTQCVHALKPQWQPALASGQLTFDGKASHLTFVLQADGTKDIAGALRSLADSSQLDPSARGNLLALLADVGEADDLRFVLDRAAGRANILEALANAARLRKKQPSGDLLAPAQALIEAPEANLRAAGLRLAGAWQLKPLRSQAVACARALTASLNVRLAAIEALPGVGGAEAVGELISLTGAEHPRALHLAAVASLAQLDLERAAQQAATLAPAMGSLEDMAALLAPFLHRQGGADALARSLSATSLPPDAAKLLSRALSSAGRSDAALLAVVHRALGLAPETAAYSREFVEQLAAEVRSRGDATRGRDVYRSELANCAPCHKIAGEGGVIGPDLTAVGRSLPLDLIIEAVLWPKRQIKEGFLLTQITTTDGDEFQGYKLKETPQELTLRELATGREVRLAKPRIQELTDSGTAMPDGLTAALRRDELRDLIRYLSELGK